LELPSKWAEQWTIGVFKKDGRPLVDRVAAVGLPIASLLFAAAIVVYLI
jgi:hypothetical protein